MVEQEGRGYKTLMVSNGLKKMLREQKSKAELKHGVQITWEDYLRGLKELGDERINIILVYHYNFYSNIIPQVYPYYSRQTFQTYTIFKVVSNQI